MRLELWIRFILLIFGTFVNATDGFIGINIGPDLSKVPSPDQVVAILKANQITHVRIFNTDSRYLSVLSNTGIEVMVGVSNNEVLELGKSASAAASWINQRVAAFIPAANITAIAVGNEVLSSNPTSADLLVSAMNYLYKALVASNLNDRIKVSTPFSMDMIPNPFPPSTAAFNASWNSTVHEILQFLKNTNSFYMLNAFPYREYVRSNGVFPIQYALFQPLLPVAKQIVDPNTLFHYESMLEAMVDAAYYSISAFDISAVPVVVTETGWPWSGFDNETDATLQNAETFNRNLIRRVLTGSGPPSQPAILLNSYIYEMFNGDAGSEAGSDGRYGVFFGNGSLVYGLEIGGSTGNSSGGFCVARKGADRGSLQSGLNWACGQGQANCSAIQTGRPCYLPNTVENHASYAYNDYYQKKRGVGGTCDFGGTGVMTTVDPSYGSCIFTGSSNSSAGTFGPPAFGPAGPTASTSPPHRVPGIGYLILVLALLVGRCAYL